MRSFIHVLYHPLSIFLILAVLAFLGKAVHWFWFSRILWLGAGLWLFMLVFTPLPYSLMRNLEQSYPSLRELPPGFEEANILVLASGFTHDTSLLPNDQLDEHMLKRLSEGIRLYHLSGGKATLYLSGPQGRRASSQASIAAETAKNIGKVPDSSLVLIEDGRITQEELEAYAAKAELSRPLIIVTAARHEKRACFIAKSLGLDPMAAPTAHLIIKESYQSSYWNIGFKGVDIMRSFLREKLGLIYFQIFEQLGWDSEKTLSR